MEDVEAGCGYLRCPREKGLAEAVAENLRSRGGILLLRKDVDEVIPESGILAELAALQQGCDEPDGFLFPLLCELGGEEQDFLRMPIGELGRCGGRPPVARKNRLGVVGLADAIAVDMTGLEMARHEGRGEDDDLDVRFRQPVAGEPCVEKDAV